MSLEVDDLILNLYSEVCINRANESHISNLAGKSLST